MKLKTLLVMAVAAIGALALSVPAFAASSSNGGIPSIDSQLGQLKAAGKAAKSRANSSKSHTKRIDGDIKRLGENVNALRKGQDATNWNVSNLAAAAVSSLTALQAGLVALSGSYTNFEYGVVQLGTCSNAACDTFTATAGNFVATPRIDPTVEQATVTAQFATIPSGILGASVAIRSAAPTANDAKSKAYCRVTTSQSPVSGANQYATSTPNGLFGGPAYQVTRSALVPTSPAELQLFPLAMVSTDTQVKLMTSANATGTGGAGGFTTATALAAAGPVWVTLSCLSVPNS